MKELEAALMLFIPTLNNYVDSKKKSIKIICLTVAYCATLVFSAYMLGGCTTLPDDYDYTWEDA